MESADSYGGGGHYPSPLPSTSRRTLAPPPSPLPKSAKKSAVTAKDSAKKQQVPTDDSSSSETASDDDSGEDDNLRVKLDGSFNNTTTYSIRSPIYHRSGNDDDKSRKRSKHLAAAKESSPKKTPGNVSGNVSWRWADGDEARKGKGKSGKKKVFHQLIQRGPDEAISVNDCAVFLSGASDDRPYVGKIEQLWETSNGAMMCRVKWFYHPEEIMTGKKFALKHQGGLFRSPHTDENDVRTIAHKCSVLPLKEFVRQNQQQLELSPMKKQRNFENIYYYLAGSYDPFTADTTFQPGVLKQ